MVLVLVQFSPCAHRLSLYARLANTALLILTILLNRLSEIVQSATSALLVFLRSCLVSQVPLAQLLDFQPLMRLVQLGPTASEELSLQHLLSPLKEVLA